MKRWLAVVALLLPLWAGSQTPSAPKQAEAPKSSGALVEVRLVSDGETWVSIEGEVRPFQFSGEKRLKLPPGTYEVVGRRKGFPDVRMPLKVSSGVPTPAVRVICQTSP